MTEPVFGSVYAAAYDALYGDKDYEAECDLLEGVFSEYGDGGVTSVLDLGCGTGAHAIRLAQRRYEVTGVDLSAEMLAGARQKADAATFPSEPPVFRAGDIRSLELGRTFDAVVMMFAVLGYQLSNEEVLATLRCARANLRRGGVLVFDVWYGPAVTRIGPSSRVKVLESGARRIIRVADGEMDERHGVCRVSYRLWELEGERLVAETVESHKMRFFYPMELELLLSQAGFVIQRLAAFPDVGSDANAEEWNALAVAT
jgi:SAM-dependent methyltransferase